MYVCVTQSLPLQPAAPYSNAPLHEYKYLFQSSPTARALPRGSELHVMEIHWFSLHWPRALYADLLVCW